MIFIEFVLYLIKLLLGSFPILLILSLTVFICYYLSMIDNQFIKFLRWILFIPLGFICSAIISWYLMCIFSFSGPLNYSPVFLPLMFSGVFWYVSAILIPAQLNYKITIPLILIFIYNIILTISLYVLHNYVNIKFNFLNLNFYMIFIGCIISSVYSGYLLFSKDSKMKDELINLIN